MAERARLDTTRLQKMATAYWESAALMAAVELEVFTAIERGQNTIPALATGFDHVKCVYEKMPGWKKSTLGVTDFDQLPKKAQDYLHFLEKESGAKIGMVSTGPDRAETILVHHPFH